MLMLCLITAPPTTHVGQHAGNGTHVLFYDVEQQHVYCAACGDYIYDSDFDRIKEYFMYGACGA
jgi:hypothetical protein